MQLASQRGFLLGAIFLTGLLAGAPAQAQARDEYGNPIDVPSDVRNDSDGDIRQTVARISDLDGSVSYARGDDPDDWQSADRNVPVTLGDRLYTGEQSRLELQVHGGSYVRLGSSTDLAVLNLTDDTKQFALKGGVASVQVRRLDSDDVYEIDTPNSAITLERIGDYRIDVDPDGNTRVSVREGSANVAAGGGSLSLNRGDALEISGTDSPQYENVAMSAPDGWDRWVEERGSRVVNSRSYQYVSNDIAGADDLDSNGRWENIPSYGSVWTPTVVAAGWAPYRDGRWTWQDPWGWTWVSAEPWGWAPYHYGRWVFWTGRWYWVPVARRASVVAYSPALVAFVGGGPGWSASVSISPGGYVGWFPLAPREPLNPWWGRHSAPRVTNITYVNRTYVTVVNQTTFVSGGLVVRNTVRDTQIIRQVEAAPVLRGPMPFVPTREAIRVSTRPAASVVRPPAALVSRPVVARVAPPPAPPTFDRKVAVIRENKGAPVPAVLAAQMAVRDQNRPQAAAAIKPVSATPGRVTLAPRERAATSAPAPNASSSAPAPNPSAGARPAQRVEPVAPLRGRAMATTEQPVANAPVSSNRARGNARDRQVEPDPSSPNPAPGQAAPARPDRNSPAPPGLQGRPTPAAPPSGAVVAPRETPSVRKAPDTPDTNDARRAREEELAKRRAAQQQEDLQRQRQVQQQQEAQKQEALRQQELQKRQEAEKRRQEAQKQQQTQQDQVERERARRAQDAQREEDSKKRDTPREATRPPERAEPPALEKRPTPPPSRREPPVRRPTERPTPRGHQPEPTKSPE